MPVVARNVLLVASALTAAAFLAWLGHSTAVVATGEVRPERPDAAAAAPVAWSSGPGTGSPGAAAPAAPVEAPQSHASAPADVLEATDRRQSAKITRGMREDPQGGVRIEEVPPGSVAAQMNLLPGDVLMDVNGVAISSPEEFARIYRSTGIQGEFVVIRNGREIHRR